MKLLGVFKGVFMILVIVEQALDEVVGVFKDVFMMLIIIWGSSWSYWSFQGCFYGPSDSLTHYRGSYWDFQDFIMLVTNRCYLKVLGYPRVLLWVFSDFAVPIEERKHPWEPGQSSLWLVEIVVVWEQSVSEYGS